MKLAYGDAALGRPEQRSVGEMERLRIYRIVTVGCDDLAWIGLCSLLQEEPLVRVVGRPGVTEAAAAASALCPDAVLVSAGLGHEAVLDLARSLPELVDKTKLLVFGHRTECDIGARLAQSEAGCFALLEDVNRRSVYWLLGAVIEAGWWVGSRRAVQELLIPERRQRLRDEDLLLTPRECTVLRDVAAGAPDEAIAQHIERSTRTVRRIAERMEERLGVRSRAELRFRAMELGF